MDQILMTLRQAAKYLDVRTKQLRELVKDGHLAAATVHDGKRLFDRVALDGLRLRGLLPPAPIRVAQPEPPVVQRTVPEQPPEDVILLPSPVEADEEGDWGLPVVPFDKWACALTTPPPDKIYRVRVRCHDGTTWIVVGTVDVAGRDLLSPGEWLPTDRDGVFVITVYAGDDVGMVAPIGSRFAFDSRSWWTTATQESQPQRGHARTPARTREDVPLDPDQRFGG
jgi:excisionase family DNA binding protein